MPIIIWKDTYSVQIDELDNQHKRLIGLINQLYDAMLAGKGKSVNAPILDELVEYAQTHFISEELLMKKCQYPGLATHKEAHEQLTQKVEDFHTSYNAGKSSISIELMNFLNNWLTDHILTMDKKYVPYLLK